jgi:Tol biopolymer transport system component
MRSICRIFLVAAALAAPSAAAAEGPLLAVATNHSVWMDEHVFTYTPGGSLQALTLGASGAVSPDSHRIAFTRGVGELWLANADGSGARQLVPAQPESTLPGSVAWAPDGTHVAYELYGETLLVVDVATGATTRFANAHLYSFEPFGHRIAFAHWGSAISVVVANVDSSDERQLATLDAVTGIAWAPPATNAIAVTGTPTHGAPGVYLSQPDALGRLATVEHYVRASSPTWSPDGRSLAYLRGTTLAVGRDRRVHALANVPGTAPAAVAWSPNSASVAVLRAGRLVVVPARGGTARMHTIPAAARISDPQLSWLGSRVVVSGRESATAPDTELALVRADGTGFRALTHDAVDERDPNWSPDGKRIAYTRPDGIWTIRRDGSGARRLAAVNASAPTYAPDGRTIAYVEAGAIRLMNADGTHRRFLVQTTWAPRQLSWTPDGGAIVYADLGGVWRIDVHSGARTQVDVGGGDNFRPTLAGDGRLAFEAFRNPRYFRDAAAWGVFVQPAAGGVPVKILTGKIGPSSWSPDGSLLALSDGTRVEIVGSDGSGLRTLFALGRSSNPVFAPSS